MTIETCEVPTKSAAINVSIHISHDTKVDLGHGQLYYWVELGNCQIHINSTARLDDLVSVLAQLREKLKGL